MKITLAIPKGKNVRKRIKKELSLAKNIKSKETRNSIIQGLNKILVNYQEGYVFLWNGSNLEIIEYPLKEFIYHCGNEFIAPEIPKGNNYLLIAMDANHCTIGMLKGKSIITLFNKKSNVPRKQDQGGQSQRRFERAREEALKQWFKKVARKIQSFQN